MGSKTSRPERFGNAGQSGQGQHLLGPRRVWVAGVLGGRNVAQLTPAFLSAHHFIVATACHEADYGQLIRDYCLSQFQASMEALGPRLWCDWEETLGTYGELTNCTALVAEKLACYWPNRLVDEFFVGLHRRYFRSCSPTGRALRDPPAAVLGPFIALPVLGALLAAALVVWRSKRGEGLV
uniref:Receptor activity-modifying protein 1 n=1 Tax=Apteryx owenii TaxID=8824 RepID=A0A8B9NWS3_APTOW